MIEFLMIIVMFFSMQIGGKIRQWINGKAEDLDAGIFLFVYGGLALWAAYLLVYGIK